MLRLSSARRPLLRLDVLTFDELLRRCDPFGPGRCLIDLRQVCFVTPTGLVCLAALCQAVQARGRASGRWATIELGDRSQRDYLVRSGLLRVLDRLAGINPTIPPVRLMAAERQRGSTPRMIEVTPLGGLDTVQDLTERVRHFALDELGYSRRAAVEVAQVFSEACENSSGHNSHPCGFTALQEYSTGSETWVEIAIADCGDGLAATLSRNPRLGSIESDRQGIRLALQDRVSEFDDRIRGTGMRHLLRAAERLGATVYLRSGTARLCIDRETPAGRYADVPWMPGVQITLLLASSRRS